MLLQQYPPLEKVKGFGCPLYYQSTDENLAGLHRELQWGMRAEVGWEENDERVQKVAKRTEKWTMMMMIEEMTCGKREGCHSPAGGVKRAPCLTLPP